jgi:hypothetical protein
VIHSYYYLIILLLDDNPLAYYYRKLIWKQYFQVLWLLRVFNLIEHIIAILTSKQINKNQVFSIIDDKDLRIKDRNAAL